MTRKNNKISIGLKDLGKKKFTGHFQKLNVFEDSPQSRTNYLELFDYALVVELTAGA